MMNDEQKKKILVGGAVVLVLLILGAALWRDEASAPSTEMSSSSQASGSMSNTSGQTPTSGDAMEKPMAIILSNGRYQIDVKQSMVGWYGAKKVGSGHRGTIQINRGSLEIVNGAPAAGEVVIDMKTLDTPDSAQATTHLKSADFFSVEAHPEAQFRLLRSELLDSDATSVTFNLVGDMTIKGITKTINFPAKLSMTNNMLVGDAKATIDRTAFDVRYGSGKFFSDLGDKIINDEFELDLRLVMTPEGQVNAMVDVK